MKSTKQSLNRYSLGIRVLHWLMAFGLFGMFFAGLYMVKLSSTDPQRGNWYYYHQSVGVLLFILASIRLSIKKTRSQPDLPEELTPLDRMGVSWVHALLYVIMFVLPLSGIGMTLLKGYGVPFFFFRFPALGEKSSEWSKLFGKSHEILAYFLMVFSGAHVIGIVKHWMIHRKNLVKRMW